MGQLPLLLSPLALPVLPPLDSLEELSSSRVSFWEPSLPAEERGQLKVTKMLPSLSCPTLNPLNATDVSSATWLLVPSPTKTKSCPFQQPSLPCLPQIRICHCCQGWQDCQELWIVRSPL